MGCKLNTIPVSPTQVDFFGAWGDCSMLRPR
jgi:hypothetical protein